MKEFLEALNNPVIQILMGSMLLIMGFLMLVLTKIAKKDREVSQMLDSMRYTVITGLDSSKAHGDVSAQRSREEITTGLRGFNDSVVRMMSEMSRTQQGQLDSFSSQLRINSRNEEERMERMRQSVEDRLKSYESRMDRIGDVLDDKLTQTEERIESMRQTVERRMVRMQEDNSLKLDEMRQTVDEKLHNTLDKRLGESFQLVSDRLEQVYKGLGEMQNLATGVGDLKRVLTGVSMHGAWGEIQLGSLLDQILPTGQYESHMIINNNDESVDFVVRLPGREDTAVMYLPIDSCFPQLEYQHLLDAIETHDTGEIDKASRLFDATIRQHARKIREWFIAPPRTTDFAIMFLPFEGCFAEVLRRPGLSEMLQSELRVIITGPTTLAAMLNSLNIGFKTLAIEKRSTEVWRLLGAVKAEFSRFAEVLSRTQKRLKQASESIDDATRKTLHIQRRLRNVEVLNDGDARRLLEYETNDKDDEDSEEEAIFGVTDREKDKKDSSDWD